MGQKVNPVGFRLGVKSKRNKIYTNPVTQNQFDIFDRKHTFNFAPKANQKENNYSSNLHRNFIIKDLVNEIFTKSGYFVSHSFIEESNKNLTIKVDVLHRQGTSEANQFQKDFALQEEKETKKNLIKYQNSDFNSEKGIISGDQKSTTASLQNEENLFSNTPVRKRTWTNRRLSWRTLNIKDLNFFSTFLEKNVTNGLPIKWKIRLLNRNVNPNTNLVKKLFKQLGRSKRQPFFNDGINVFSLVLNEPHAPLLAEYISYELSQLRRHSGLVQFIKEGLTIGLEENEDSAKKAKKDLKEPSKNLKGFLIQIKGRINGSDRSRSLKSRMGSVPLHTIDAPLDYAFSEALTAYGKCSVKVWLKYDLFTLGVWRSLKCLITFRLKNSKDQTLLVEP